MEPHIPTDAQQSPRPRLGDRWLTIPEAAALAHVPVHTMRRRVKSLDRMNPKLGLLRRPGKREFLVSAEALQRALTTDPDLGDSELDAVHSRLTALEDKTRALQKSHKALKAQTIQIKEQLALSFAG